MPLTFIHQKKWVSMEWEIRRHSLMTCHNNQKLHEQSRPFKVYPLFEDKCALIFFLDFVWMKLIAWVNFEYLASWWCSLRMSFSSYRCYSFTYLEQSSMGKKIRTKILLGRRKGGICTKLHVPRSNIPRASVLLMEDCLSPSFSWICNPQCFRENLCTFASLRAMN